MVRVSLEILRSKVMNSRLVGLVQFSLFFFVNSLNRINPCIFGLVRIEYRVH